MHSKEGGATNKQKLAAFLYGYIMRSSMQKLLYQEMSYTKFAANVHIFQWNAPANSYNTKRLMYGDFFAGTRRQGGKNLG